MPLLVRLAICSLFLIHALPAAPAIHATVSAAGDGDYRTVQAAVDAAPTGRTAPWIIAIKPGRYQEHIIVPKEKPFLTFLGTDSQRTVLTNDTNFNTLKPDGQKMSAQESATVLIHADNFTAERLTFENTTTRAQRVQALALYMTGDRGVFRGCRFLGWQDTLRADSPRAPQTEPDAPRHVYARQYFVDCYIEGHVDFIYAASTAVFDRCHIHCLADGYITAASTPRDVAYGYVFLDCKITTGPEIVKGAFLGRPWRPHAATVFIRTEIGAGIRPEGWDNWRNPSNEKTARYAEYCNTGPGAHPAQRVSWVRQLTDEEAATYTVENILAGRDGWNPSR